MANQVEIFLVLRQIRKFLEDADKASKAIRQIGKEGETAGEKMKLSAKQVARWAGGAISIYGATKFLKGAVEDVETLAVNTKKLTASTGMDAKTGSEWLGVLGERHIAVQTFQVSLKTLSKQMETARLGTAASSAVTARLKQEIDAVAAAGGKNAPKMIGKLSQALARAQGAGEKARKAFAGLGVSQQAIANRDTPEVLMELADGLQKIPAGSQRLAAAATVLGRGGTALLPLLQQGRAGVEALLEEQAKLGHALTDKQERDVLRLVGEQRSLNTAWEGARVQIALALVPALTQLAKFIHWVAENVSPLTKNVWVMRGVLVLAAAAMATLIGLQVAFKVAMISLARSSKVAAGGVAELDAAMLPVWLTALIIVAAIALIIVEIIELKKHYRGINQFWADVWQGMKDIYNWVVGHWTQLVQFLTAPFISGVELIVSVFGSAKGAVTGVISWVISKVTALVDWVVQKASEAEHALVKIVPGGGLLYSAGGAVAGLVGAGNGKAGGGPIGMTGNYLVGERGPEIVTLPRGAYVTPNSALAAVAGGGSRMPPLELTVPLVVDGREIARAVARVSADRQARR